MKKNGKAFLGIAALVAAAAIALAGCSTDGGDNSSGGGGGGGTPTVEVAMVQVTGGAFTMGDSDYDYALVQHEVTVSGFYIGKYEITKEQYKAVMGNQPSHWWGPDNCPVERVRWYDAVEFCNKLSQMKGLEPVYAISDRYPPIGYPITNATVTMDMGKSGYRLPTEAEWEYAARGGVNWNNPYYTYAGSNTAGDVAWYGDRDGGTHEVGGKAPNGLGLYDMSGNVAEWCWDWYGEYSTESQTDPTGAPSGDKRVYRGGGYVSVLEVRSVVRGSVLLPSNGEDWLGFRVVRR